MMEKLIAQEQEIKTPETVGEKMTRVERMSVPEWSEKLGEENVLRYILEENKSSFKNFSERGL